MRQPVHPHSRGEHAGYSAEAMGEIGSSPLARGTLFHKRWLQAAIRFIPTRAGNTLATSVLVTMGSVHPHSRGEHPKPNTD
ncbi:conserved hypothetical protein [Nitrospira defluvii]|uniref:Uncharacterized protein n=1 Tax=Nitrospira defluvii TaxID=330214 RepID=A0ABM8S437_9BACT|nr:conserved hypothetical protein [Nitrospira defluvii]